MSTAFITGCGSGFGKLLAERLLGLGHRVIATDPHLGSLDGLTGDVLKLALDVCSPDQVRDAAARALAWGAVDVLVNNAGYAVFGSQEEADLDAIDAMFDVNVMGVARVTQALLPSIRATRGTIVQLSSVAGRTVFTESGFYAATKYAVEAMSEALIQETATFGVRVRLIEPGSFDTGFLDRARRESLPRAADSPYSHVHAHWDRRKFALLEPPQDPRLVVDAIVASLADPAPFKRIPVGPDSIRMLALRDKLGADAYSRLGADRNGLAESPHGPSEVASPAEVLAGLDGDALIPTLHALDHGHLEHWNESESGRAALERLAARAKR